MAKKSAKRSSYIAKAPIRRLMKNEGADLVAEDALDLLIEELTKKAEEITKNAAHIANSEKRKRVSARDIQAAVL